MDETLLERIFRALLRESVRYAVFGGVALNLHGIVRTTVIAAVNLGRVLSGQSFPLGVHKSRSIEELARLRERWEAESGRSPASPDRAAVR